MRAQIIHIVMIFFIAGTVWSQGDGVVSYSLPVRNSLTFNRFALSPTFTFVREENKTLSFTNKREWVQFENAPVSYVFGYNGRLNERSGAGISLFQRNYGVLTTFGGVLNYAYNVPLSYDNNLTFGANLALYQSGINTGNVISTLPDPSLNNVPSNFLMTFNPSINYGTQFLDVGLTLRNYTLYNFTNSNLVEDDPEQGIQAHLMYTGFLQSGGFFDNSKFSGLVRSEFKNSGVVLSGLMMLTVPKGIWGQVGYHTQNGVSVGIGANLLKGIAIEYNYENGITNSINLGSSHEITLAYRFENKKRYSYGDDMQMSSLIPERRPVKYHKTDEATRARMAARAKTRQQQRDAALLGTSEITTANVEANPSEQSNLNQRQLEIAAAKQKAEELAKEKAEAEALEKLKAKQLKEEEEQRLARLKASEEQRRKEALAALAAAEAEENRLKEEKRQNEARRLAEEQAKIRAEEEAAQEAARLARLREDEEKRRKEALAILAAAEAEEKRQEEERIAELERNRAEKEAQRLAAIAKEEEAKRLAMLKAEREERQQKAMAALLAAEAEESKPKSDTIRDLTSDEMKNEVINASKKISDEQDELLTRLEATVDSRKQDLADLKEENDLSEQGIFKAPKPFKSSSEQNAQLETLTFEIDKTIAAQEQRLNELQKLYDERKKEYPSDDDEMNMIYLDEILIVQKSKRKAEEAKKALMFELAAIKQATDIERKRRIKRAAFDNQEDRYAKDMADLKRIKESTSIDADRNNDNTSLDYGESSSGTIKILKDIKHNEEGYYLVMAVHSDKNKRDEFLRAAVKRGEADINFFYDVNTSKYYIYSKKFTNLKEANEAMASKNVSSLNKNLSMIKIENKSMK